MPRPRKTANKTAYIANESFVMNVGGVDKAFHQNRTRVYEGDEAYQKAPHLFDLLEDYDENQAYD